jgi:hypothetical protein
MFWYDEFVWEETNDLLRKSNSEYYKWEIFEWEDVFREIMKR